MGRTQTMVQLNDALLEVLDRRATETGRSRSDLIREAIEQYYKEDIEAAIDRAMIEGYTRVPDDDELGAFYDDLARRSIAEEPW